MKPRFSGSSSASSEPLKSGMPSKLTAKITSVARPHSISRMSSTKPKMASCRCACPRPAASRRSRASRRPPSRWLARYRPRHRKGPTSRKPADSASTQAGACSNMASAAPSPSRHEAAAVEEADAGAARCARSSAPATARRPPRRRSPGSPKAGRPNSVGPPLTVMTIDEPMISAAITSAIASRLAARSIWSPTRLRWASSMPTCTCPRRALRSSATGRAAAARPACRAPGAASASRAGQRLGPVARAQHLAQQRQRLGGHVEAGVEAAAHAFQRDEGLDQQRQVGGQRQVVLAQDGGHVGQHLAQAAAAPAACRGTGRRRPRSRLQLRQVGAAGVAGPVQQHVGHRLRLRSTRPSSSCSSSSRRRGDSRPTMPKSMKAMRLPGR
jgi:hypothetical protein